MQTFRAAEKIVGVDQHLHTSWDRKWAGKTITGPSHPEHDLCELLPSGRRCTSPCAKTSRGGRHMNCFTPQAIALTHTRPCDVFWLWTNKIQRHVTWRIDHPNPLSPREIEYNIFFPYNSGCKFKKTELEILKKKKKKKKKLSKSVFTPGLKAVAEPEDHTQIWLDWM